MLMAHVWEQIHSQRDWGKYPNEELIRFIARSFFKIPKIDRKKIKVLELGCGQGANLWFLGREGFDVYGIDISQSAIEKAKQTLKDWNIESVKLDVQDIVDIHYPDNFFDVIIDCSAVCNVSFTDHKKIYKSVHRILKKDGIFWTLHYSDDSWGFGSGNLIDYKTFDNLSTGVLQNLGVKCLLSDLDLKKLLTNTDFRVSNIEKYSRTYDNSQHSLCANIVEATKQ
jgi:ubiquinone/menaquinone biosynthesis C-methylase UbiE